MNILSVIPVVGSAFAAFSFLTAYIVAVSRGDVYPWWPYISDTGTTIPESCIFGELLTLTAIFAFVTMVIRYKWVESFNNGAKKLGKLNGAALIIGLVSCLGMTLVANFEETSVRAVHFPSAAMAFGLAILYNFMNAEITRRMSPEYSSTCVWIYRLAISFTGLLAFGLLYGFGAGAEMKGKHWYGNDTRKKLEWNPHDPGWGMHLVASVSEWMIGLTIILFFLTYSFEFGKIKIKIVAETVAPPEREIDETAPLIT